jgi:hypothetical protein
MRREVEGVGAVSRRRGAMHCAGLFPIIPVVVLMRSCPAVPSWSLVESAKGQERRSRFGAPSPPHPIHLAMTSTILPSVPLSLLPFNAS